MPAAARFRKLALTAHVVASVGWLDSVVAFLMLAITGRASGDPELVRGSWRKLRRDSQPTICRR